MLERNLQQLHCIPKLISQSGSQVAVNILDILMCILICFQNHRIPENLGQICLHAKLQTFTKSLQLNRCHHPYKILELFPLLCLLFLNFPFELNIIKLNFKS